MLYMFRNHFCYEILIFCNEYITQIWTPLILNFPNTERSQMELSSSRSPAKTKSQQPFPSPIFSKDLLTPHSEAEPDITAYCFWSDFYNKKKYPSMLACLGYTQIGEGWERPTDFSLKKRFTNILKYTLVTCQLASSAEEERPYSST